LVRQRLPDLRDLRVPVRLNRVVSGPHTGVPAVRALPHALAASFTRPKNSRNPVVKPERATIRKPSLSGSSSWAFAIAAPSTRIPRSIAAFSTRITSRLTANA
jgi:hypothetical protein